MKKLDVSFADDFEVTGDGSASAWSSVEWQPLSRVGQGPAAYPTRFKALYSPSGIYFLCDGEDRRLTATLDGDNLDLFTEDVFEVFLWTDEAQTIYFEYEISPLDHELPIVVPNHKGRFHGWLPWHGEGPRATRHATSVRGGPKASGAAISGWSAEFFIPFALFQGLGNERALPGTTWRANVYRIDYDSGEPSHWAWNTATSANFHDFRNFGTFHFL
ncbi:MAG: carbohydrate-binding family 9-like protein [Kiritimatiellia bacterium]|jgi:hypothetical protein